MKLQSIRSITTICLFALLSQMLTFEAISAETEPNATDSTVANIPSAIKSGLILQPASPVLVARMTDTLDTDADHDGKVSPGDVLQYEVAIHNNGLGAATGVVFSDTPDRNTILITGTVETGACTITTGNNPGDTIVNVNVGDLKRTKPD